MTYVRRVSAAWGRLDRTPEWPLLVGVLLALAALVEVVGPTGQPAHTLRLRLVLAAAATLPVALARTQVLPATAVCSAATVLTLAAHQRPTVAGLIAQAALFYLLGRRRAGWVSVVPLVPYLVGTLVPYGWAAHHQPFALLLLASTAGPLAAGTATWLRAEAASRDASRRAIADTMLEHVARGERVRIARELHDVVAHHISMIAVQAETARLTTPGLPREGADRLVAIGDTARTALAEMRRLLGVLRADAGPQPARTPQPGLEQLNELIDEARASAGASTRLILTGPVVPLDPGVQLTAYRIVQEALTNVRRHAPGAAVDVELAYTHDALRVRVRDNGPGPRAARGGHGLLGMRERVAMTGGQLRAGPGRDCGFVVEAVLPTEGARP